MTASTLMTLTDPFFLAHRALRRLVRQHASGLKGITLDVGCGLQPYRELFPGPIYIGLEIPKGSLHGSAKKPDIYFDGHRLPFMDSSVDVVFCSQVLEHIFEPSFFLDELRRVLKPNGKLLLTTPFVWDEHEQPFDFARYSSFGLRSLASRHGFDVVSADKTLADASLLAQLFLTYLFKVFRRHNSFLLKFFLALTAVPINIIGAVVAIISPRNDDLYLDNVMLWRKSSIAIEAQAE